MSNVNINRRLILSAAKPTDTTVDNKQAFLVIGDSTSAGSNNNTGNGPSPVSGTAYYYRRSTTDIVQISTDIVAAPLGTQYPQFCTDYFNGSGKKAVIIPTGFGGSNFAVRTGESGNWSTTGTLYALAVTDAMNALSILGLTKLKCIFISSLGINDARGTTSLAQIQSDMVSLITRLRTDFPGVPIMIEQIGRSEVASLNARIGTIRGYLKDIALTYNDVYLMGGILSCISSGGYGADNLHPSQTGNNNRGAMYARWMLNSSYSKWSRSIISSMYDELSVARKGLIENFITNNLTDYLEHDFLQIYKTTTINNLFNDWCFLNSPINSGVTFTANDSISTNGTSTYFRTGQQKSFNQKKGTTTDNFEGFRIKTNGEAGTVLKYAFGATDTLEQLVLAHANVAGLVHRNNDLTLTIDLTENKFANSSEYLACRNGTTKSLYKNGSLVSSVTQAAIGDLAAGTYVGAANNNNTGILGYFTGSFEYARGGKFSTINHATFKTALNTLLTSW